MARAKSHKDVEFAVSSEHTETEEHYRTLDEAASEAMKLAMRTGEATLDVLIYHEAGARWWGGDDAVDEYNEDPEASVFERFEVSVNLVGRVV